MNAAPALSGQSSGLIKKVISVEEIINQTVAEFNDRCKQMSNYKF